MRLIKRIVPVLMAVLLLAAAPLTASAATDEIDRRDITDQIFEWMYPDGLCNEYRKMTQSVVKVEHNPMAAMAYMRIEAEIAVCDNNLLQELSDEKIDIGEFFENDEFDYTKAKQIDKYKNSLIVGAECWFDTYDYGIWAFDDEYGSVKFYGYFKEDDENFTLYEDGTDKVLGVYPKLIGYTYLDDEAEAGNGGVGGGSGFAGGSNGTASVTSSEYSDDEADYAASRTTGNTDSDKKVMGTPNSYEDDEADGASPKIASGNNPAVTPEIASTVDALKASASAQTDEKIKATTVDTPPSHTVRNVVIFIVALAAAAIFAYFIAHNKKGDKNTNN